MSPRGFSLVELLVATLVCAALAGAAALVAVPARAAFAATPAAIDVEQRARTALEALAAPLRSAGAYGGAGPRAAPLAAALPVVTPFGTPRESDGAFPSIRVISVVPDGARGVLAVDQAGPGGALTLDPASGCPEWKAPCGFVAGATAVVADGLGRFEVFEVGAVAPGALQLRATRPLAMAYPAGSMVTEVSADRFELVAQPDGSRTLSKVTAAGASQPIVDRVLDMSFAVWGVAAAPSVTWADGRGSASYGPPPADPDGPALSCAAVVAEGEASSLFASWGDDGQLVPIDAADVGDGPFCAAGPPLGDYDIDLFRIARVEVALTLEPPPVVLRHPGHDVPPRVVRASIAVRNR